MDQTTYGDVFMEDLAVPLTNTEIVEAGKGLSDHLVKKAEVEAEKKDVVTKYNGRIAALDNVIDEISNAIKYGVTKPVECAWLFHWGLGEKTLIRRDTGEEVRTAKITPEDKQLKLA